VNWGRGHPFFAGGPGRGKCFLGIKGKEPGSGGAVVRGVFLRGGVTWVVRLVKTRLGRVTQVKRGGV